MSSIHNNARRHRQVLKKRVVNDMNDLRKRSPPQDRINNPPPVATQAQALPPIGGDPPNDPDNPAGPAGGGGNNRPTVDPRPSRTPPGQQSQTTVRQQPTQPTPPQVPVNTSTGALSSTTPLVPTPTISTTSTTLSTTSTSVISTPSTTIQPTTQIPTAPAVTNSFTAPSITPGGFTDTASTPSASSTATPSDGLSTGSVVGIVAASLVAVAAVVVVGMWLTKRYFKKREEDEFSRNSFIRQSVHIPDEADDYRSPRPPTMIERHYGAVSPQPGYGNNMYAPPVPPMPSLYPGEMMMANHAPVIPNPFAGGEYSTHASQQQQQPALVRVSSNGSAHSFSGGSGVGVSGTSLSPPPAAYPSQGGYNTQQNQSTEAQGHLSPIQGQGYADLQRSSVTPYQAAQYAEISRQLNIPSVANSPVSPSFAQSPVYGRGVAAGLGADDARLPTPAPPSGGPQRVMSPNSVRGYQFPMPLSGSTSGPPVQAPASVAHAAALAALGNQAPSHLTPGGAAHGAAANGRPATMYDDDDAYGGM